MVREIDQKDQRHQEVIMISEWEGSQRTIGLTSQPKQDSPAQHLSHAQSPSLKTSADEKPTTFPGAQMGSVL